MATLYDKLWQTHEVLVDEAGYSLLYIDRHLVHEVTSPQAFESLQITKRDIWRKNSILAVPDHNVPTVDRQNIEDLISKKQIDTLDENCKSFSLNQIGLLDNRQGIVHIIGPEQGWTIPGISMVCGDSHTSTNGAFGALAFGIGTTQIEHVFATQCIRSQKAKNMLIDMIGKLPNSTSAKDLILYLIRQITTAGGNGYAIEYAGECISQMSMAGRMTICNMSTEAGAKCGLIAVDDTTIDYVRERPYAPRTKHINQAVDYWRTLTSDSKDDFDKIIEIDVEQVAPQISWGNRPDMVTDVDGYVPDPNQQPTAALREDYRLAQEYMDLKPGTQITQIKPDKIFLGSCTNSRIEDLRAAAAIVNGKKIADNIKLAMVVPGSGLIKAQAEREGLDKIFSEAGFEWRDAGCSMCLGMNNDRLDPHERCASTSNRNFEGRQGYLSRTHLMSPISAAATAIAGHICDVREII